MSLTNIIMDVILMALLVAALVFGMRLDKRLKALRAAHEGFAKAVHDLDDAAIRAHASLKELRGHADESQDLLHGRILAARDVLQKLDMQVTRAERVQAELDKGLVSYEAIRSQTVTRPAANEVIRPAHHEAEAVARPRDRSAFMNEVRPDRTPYVRTANNRTGRSLLPDIEPEDESEIIDKVQMSELVVANLNEMIRTLNLPARQVASVEDDLFARGRGRGLRQGRGRRQSGSTGGSAERPSASVPYQEIVFLDGLTPFPAAYRRRRRWCACPQGDHQPGSDAGCISCGLRLCRRRQKGGKAGGQDGGAESKRQGRGRSCRRPDAELRR
ncbi:MAG: DUF6468 domain-containing protein [Asticcacaulis sp.]|nr:DUF6468 domain-containing protein [Asticcacaulis sp.]